MRRDDINDFKRLYTKLFSGNKKYPPVEEILADLDIKYLVMTIKAGDEIIGFATYRELGTNKLEILNWYGPRCSNHEKFTPPGFQGHYIEKSSVTQETVGICTLCESWTC